jgi:hypothetical protein
MKQFALLFAALALVSITGCPGSNTPADTGVDARSNADTGVVVDTGSVVVDTGSVVVDTGSVAIDTGSVVADTGPRGDAGMCGDYAPTPTRPSPTTCNACRPPSLVGSGGTETNCMGDADCTMGMNGRCTFGRIGPHCTYDTCFSDSDCGADQVCLCDGGDGGGNHCITTTCGTNNDCGGQTCSPTFGSCGNYAGIVSYACHTTSDECTVDSDCAGVDAYCKFDPAVSHWVCSDLQCVG